MKAEHINPFLNSTLNVFESMLGSQPQVGQKSLMKNFYTHRWDISGVIGITGTADGVIAIRLTHKLVEKILEKSEIVCSGPEETAEIINGMVGEIINMIAGNALGEITRFDLDITVPFVVQGDNHSIGWPRNNPIIAIPFITNYGPFEVNVSLRDNFYNAVNSLPLMSAQLNF